MERNGLWENENPSALEWVKVYFANELRVTMEMGRSFYYRKRCLNWSEKALTIMETTYRRIVFTWPSWASVDKKYKTIWNENA